VGNEESKVAIVEAEVTLPLIGGPGSNGTLAVFPNPARSTVNVSINSTDEGTLLLTFTTPIGQRAIEWSTGHPGGSARYTIPIGSLAPGVYFVKAAIGSKMIGEARLVVVP
jgi:hypothetical protein